MSISWQFGKPTAKAPSALLIFYMTNIRSAWTLVKEPYVHAADCYFPIKDTCPLVLVRTTHSGPTYLSGPGGRGQLIHLAKSLAQSPSAFTR